MSLQVGELHALLKLDDKPFQRGISSSKGLLKGVGVAAAAAGVATAAALGTAAVKGVQEFAGLQRGMNEVFTLLPGISQQAMDAMTGQVRAFSTDFGVLPDEVVPALYQSLSAGVPQGNVFEFLETANQAAVGGVTDLTTAVDGISSVVNAYGDQIGGAGEASDLMFTAVRLGKTTFEELSASLSNVTPIAAANNVAFSDVTAALATMTAQGIPTAQATTQIRQAIVELSDAGTGVGETFEKVAGKSFRTFMEEGGTLGEALAMLEGEAAKSGVTVDQMFGSVEAGGAALALGGANAENYAAAVEEMGKSAGATEGAYEQMDQGLSRSWDRIKAAGAVLLGHLGEELAPAFESLSAWVMDNMPTIQQTATQAFRTIGTFVTETLIPAFQSLLAWWDENGPTIVAAAQMLAAGLIDTFTVINDAVTRATDWLHDAFGGGGQATGTLGGFAATMAGWGEQIVATLGSAFDAIRGLFEFLVTFTTWIWNNWGEDLIRLVTGNWEMIKGIIDGALDVIQGVFEIFAGIFTGDWQRLWDGVKQVASGLWNAIQALWDGLWNQFAVIFNVGADIMSTVWAKLWTDIKATFTQIRDQLVETWTIFWATLQAVFDVAAAALLAVWNAHWADVKAEAKAVWDSFAGLFSDGWAAMRAVYDNVSSALREAWDTWTGGVGAAWDLVWTTIHTGFNALWEPIRGAVESAIGPESPLRTAWDTFTTAITDGWDGIWSGIEDGWDDIKSGLEGLVNGLVSTLGDAWDGIKKVFSGPIRWVQDKVINGFIGAVNSISSKLGAGDILTPITLVPEYHTGGVVGEARAKVRDLAANPLKSDEQMAVLRKGERVLTQQQAAGEEGQESSFLGGGRAGDLGGKIVPIPEMPGELIHRNILEPVREIINKYKVHITDGYATSGHKASGEHPVGLAVDIVPGAGGSWDLVDKLAALAEPEQGKPVHPFKWVGYDGDAGHGRGHHLHLSWKRSFFDDPTGGGEGSGGGIFDVIGPLIKKMISPITGLLDHIPGSKLIGGLLKAASTKLVDVGVDWLKDKFSFGGDPGGSGVERWRDMVLQALSITGNPAAHADLTLRRMNQESGGVADIVNNWDSNATKGTPSVGLMQVIGPTYSAYKHPEFDVGPYVHGTSINPLANTLASIGYAVSRYGSLPTAYNRPGGYDLGGLLQPGFTPAFNFSGKPELVTALDVLDDALDRAVARGFQAGKTGMQTAGPFDMSTAAALAGMQPTGKSANFYGDIIVPDREAVQTLRHDMEFAMEEMLS